MSLIADTTELPAAIAGGCRTLHTALLSRNDCPYINRFFDAPARERIERVSFMHPVILTPARLAQMPDVAERIEVLFTCWGAPASYLTLEKFPSLRAVFHSGGTVRFFAKPLLERGVTISCARAANAITVARFCLAQIILSCKGYFMNVQMSREPGHRRTWKRYMGPGLNGERVALIGMGAVARELAPMLRNCDLQVLAVDPYLTPQEAADLGVEVVSLEEAFATALVVSNHLPDIAELRGVLNKPLFASMRPYSTFMNTGRGAQVNEADLIDVARQRPDLTALLDVTFPEPPVEHSPLYELPNIHLSTHIAGAINDEIGRLGEFMAHEFERYAAGLPLRHAVDPELFDRLA